LKLKGKIATIIVTFNRLDMLKDTIESLRNQTKKIDKIIVVNNSSSDGTEEWLNLQSDLLVLKQDNLGSSGGQYTGWKTAYELGYEWLWVMDDDVLPELDCLEKIWDYKSENIIVAPLRYTPLGLPFVESDIKKANLSNPFKSIWKEMLISEDLKNEKIQCDGITFEGPLLHYSVIDKIGLPQKNFFIYGDDTEYSIRALKFNIKSYIITSAKLNRRLEYIDLTKSFNWKHFYIIRNLIAIDKLNSNFWVRNFRPFGYLFAWAIKANPFEYKIMVLNGFLKGIFYKSQN
jgi:GT2 family glycosyltransferase